LRTTDKKAGAVLALCAVLSWTACGKKAEAPATAEGTAVAAPAGDRAAAFQAKVAEVDAYMTAHDLRNTTRQELVATLEEFQKDFEALAAEAAGDEEVAARSARAAEGMALYVRSLHAPPQSREAEDLAADARVKWTAAKESAAGGPGT
jgi:hypothetical protein